MRENPNTRKFDEIRKLVLKPPCILSFCSGDLPIRAGHECSIPHKISSDGHTTISQMTDANLDFFAIVGELTHYSIRQFFLASHNFLARKSKSPPRRALS
ncbi:hypothetical protein [Burkholderia gladioli]|uniref:hypothetical protein n=1 Tax=Burkholderia gladioli TaxID=28095 RepID=UPI00164061BA|nr:hypothetical protein [Burkholderia gladioli]